MEKTGQKRKKDTHLNQHAEEGIYVSDAPAIDPKADRFNRLPFARRVARTLARQEDPTSLVVAIHGAWGEGKSTVLAYIESEITQAFPNVVCVRFNPWRFTDETALLRSFFDTIAHVLKSSTATWKQRVGKVLHEYGRMAAVSFDYQGAKFSVGEGVQDLGAYWSTVSLEELKGNVEKILVDAKRRIVVLIDDIDRLERAEVRQLFKLIKLTGDLQHVSYVLAFDRDMVAGALGETYGSGRDRDGLSFLEKVVQVPLDLPLADPPALQQYCFDHVNEALRVAAVQLPVEVRAEFEETFEQHLSPKLDTPRTAKRYANALAFVMPLLPGEVNPCDVMLLEAIKSFFPSLYSAIREAPENFTGSPRPRSSRDCSHAKEWMQELLERNQGSEQLVQKMFPLVRGVLRDGKFSDADEAKWSRNQRVAARQYLRRYLSCTIPSGDIPDRDVETILAEMKTLTVEDASKRFSKFIERTDARSALWKIRVRIDEMDPQFAQFVAKAIARSGTAIPGPTDRNSLFSVMSSAAFVIRLLLRRITDLPSRIAAARDVLAASTPLSFAQLCLQAIRSQGDQLEALFTDVTELATIVADRVADLARQKSVWKEFPAGLAWLILLHEWQKSRGSEPLYGYYRRVLEQDPQEAVELVTAQLGLYVPGPFMNEFQESHYGNLALLANPADVCAALGRVPASTLTPEQEKLTVQFQMLYAKDLARQSTEADPC